LQIRDLPRQRIGLCLRIGLFRAQISDHRLQRVALRCGQSRCFGFGIDLGTRLREC
jgi:hypothetical protein